MLKPNRLRVSSLERTKTVKWELARRFPARYTASNAPRRTRRASRGKVRPDEGLPLLGSEPMTSLLAACRKHFAATRSLHAGAKPVCLGAAPAPRLKRTLWQSIPPCYSLLGRTRLRRRALYRFLGSFRNYLVYLRPTHRVKKPAGMRLLPGKRDHPPPQ
jgi:hypothetical protein